MKAKRPSRKPPLRFPELTTGRLRLSQIFPDDIQFIFEGLSDPVAMPYYGVYYQTVEETVSQLDWYEGHLYRGTGVAWKISSLDTSESLGVISLHCLKPEHRKVELGYWLLPRFWGKGFASEALGAVISYVKEKGMVHRVEAFVEEENRASIRLLEGAGFVLEGTMRECEMKFGRFISLRIYALLFPVIIA